MPTSLDPITEEELRPGDARGRLGTIRKLAAMYNAWLNPQIRHDTGKEDIQFSDSNVVIEYQQGGGGGGSGGTAAPTPFQFLQVAPKTNAFVLNPDSYFRADATSFSNTGITGSTNTFSFADGDIVYLQFDAADDGASLAETSLVQNQTGPGNAVITFGGSGTGSDPYLWDQSFALIAQVFAADASGDPVRGGLVYTVDADGTRIEVVQLTCTHLALSGALVSGRYGMMPDPPSGPLLS